MFSNRAYDTFQEFDWSKGYGYRLVGDQVFRVPDEHFASEGNVMVDYFLDKSSYQEFVSEIQEYVDKIDADNERVSELLASEEGVKTITSLLSERDEFISLGDVVWLADVDPREPLEELDDMGMLEVKTEEEPFYRLDADSDAYWLHEIANACEEHTEGRNSLQIVKNSLVGTRYAGIDQWDFLEPDEE